MSKKLSKIALGVMVFGLFLVLAPVSTVIPFALFLSGIRRIGATRGSITCMIEPIAAGVFAFAFLKEAMAPPQMAGAGLVLVGIAALQLVRDEAAPPVT